MMLDPSILASVPQGSVVKVSDISFAGENIVLSLTVENWWGEKNLDFKGETVKMLCALSSYREFSSYWSPLENELLELTVSDDHNMIADYLTTYSLYGNAPLPDPYRFYWDFSVMLRDEFGSLRNPDFYLAVDATLKGWMSNCYNRAFFLGRVPEIMLARTQELLDVQACEYQALKNEVPECTDKLFIRSNLFWAVAGNVSLQLVN
ncbi:MAG: hypothetical protein IT292_03370 [Deltaproteobacteria bacterium]|nr:hypothetical protein [Deltaproteobacteria bacterium]